MSRKAKHRYSTRAKANEVHLRLLETTDLHAHVFPFDYFSDAPLDSVGLARTAALVEKLRAGATNALLFDNGDFLQGNPMGDFIAYERGLDDGCVHPVIAAMNVVGYDALTIGNHDFNYGIDFLLNALAGTRFPAVCANVVTRRGATPLEDETLLPPTALLEREVVDGAGERRKIRVGLVGFLPPQITTWDRRQLEGKVTTRDIVETAQAHVSRLRERGADLVVALNHSGIGEPVHVERQENASVPLAAVEGIDVVLAGHQHLTFPGPAFSGIPGVDGNAGRLHGKPAVMAGFWGSHLGVIDLLLEQAGGIWRVAAHECSVRPIAQREADNSIRPLVRSRRKVLDAAASAHRQTLAYIRRAVGRTARPLHSYFALVAEDPAVRLVSDAQEWYVRDLLHGTEHASLPLLSAAAPFRAGGRAGPSFFTDVSAGDIAVRNVADLYLYPNMVRAVRITGADLRGWLERSASVFNRIVPGRQEQPLVDPDYPSYNFDVIHGVEYRIDLSQPARFGTKGELLDPGGRRIATLTRQGLEVTDEMEVIVATNSYRAGGGGGFPGAGGDTIVLEAPDSNRDTLMRYIAECGTVDPAPHRNWGFVPMPGTSVLLDTGPGALNHLDSVGDLDIRPVGTTDEGFLRLRLRL